VRNGKVSAEKAREVYGVEIDSDAGARNEPEKEV
jgi:hypothetical protein